MGIYQEAYRAFRKFARILARILGVLVTGVSLSSCAYKLGSPDRSLPGGYKQVHIPIFKNLSLEPGVEVAFTNALRQEFERSHIARIAEPKQSEVILEGSIMRVEYRSTSKKQDGDSSIPNGTVLTSEYAINIDVVVNLRRFSDNKVLWSGSFTNERLYAPPRLAAAGINTVNPLYNLSARRQNIDVMAEQLMSEAHDRLTENF